jgi:hypothetical protein
VHSWEWKAGRPVLRPIHADDPVLQLYQGTQRTKFESIKRTKPTDASRILGVHISPVRDFLAQIQVLEEKSEQFAILLKSPKLSSNDVRICHKTMYGPAMTYPLVAMAVDEEELDCIQTPVLPILVQKLGLNRNLPVAIRHGPIELGGLALTDLRTELGIKVIKYFRNAIYSKSAAGDLILATLKYLQQESGIGEALLEVPSRYVPYLTPTWVTSIRQYMSNHNLSITLTNVLSLTVTRSGDSFIMVGEHLSRYSDIQQKDINLVRMYLQVTFLSDMAAPDGKTLLAQYLQGDRPHPFDSTAIWPRQENPTSSQKKLWRKYVASSFLQYPPYLLHRIGPVVPLVPNPTEVHFPTKEAASYYLSLDSYISALPRTHRRFLCDYSQKCTDIQLWRAFRSHRRLEVITDGGLHATSGTFGWKIIDNRKSVLYQGSGPVDGPFDSANST